MELPIWTPDELGEALHVRPSTLTKWRRSGEGPRAIRVARRIFYLTHDVIDWLEMLPKAEGSPGKGSNFGPNRRNSSAQVGVHGPLAESVALDTGQCEHRCTQCGVVHVSEADALPIGWVAAPVRCVACSYTS